MVLEEANFGTWVFEHKSKVLTVKHAYSASGGTENDGLVLLLEVVYMSQRARSRQQRAIVLFVFGYLLHLRAVEQEDTRKLRPQSIYLKN